MISSISVENKVATDYKTISCIQYRAFFKKRAVNCLGVFVKKRGKKLS